MKTSCIGLCYLIMASALLLTGVCAKAGELQDFAPKPVEKLPIKVKVEPGGAVSVSLDSNSYTVETMLSAVPGWVKLQKDSSEGFDKQTINKNGVSAKARDFTLERKVVIHDECVEIFDTITNSTAEILPVIYRNQFSVPKAEIRQRRLCGYPIYMKNGRQSNACNPTAICVGKKSSFGIVALDDVYRVHSLAYSSRNTFGLADNNLALEPNQSRTMRFAVFPVRSNDYYDSVNAMRRFLGYNYEIRGSFSFLCAYPKGVRNAPDWCPEFYKEPYPDRTGCDHSEKEIAEFINYKNATFVATSDVRQHGVKAHGSGLLKTMNVERMKNFSEKIRRAVPGTGILHYFHCYLDQREDCEGKFMDSRILTPSGKQGDYRNPELPLLFPTLENSFAKIKDETFYKLLDEVKVDGLYWDEFGYSAQQYHYGEPWDKCSADIDPVTHKVSTLKSSINILSQPWRLKLVKELADRKKMLIVNGGCGGGTTTMDKLFIANKYTGFVETAALTNLYQTHLTTPIGLGDHRTERSERDCYRQMVKHLNYGALYYWYHQQVMPITHTTLTTYMFPITPVELHEGYIIGKERILSAKSGWFSFGDACDVEAHFYNDQGIEEQRKLELKTVDGKTYFKVELSKWESCALVRK